MLATLILAGVHAEPAADAQTGETVAFVDVNVIPMDSDRVLQSQTVVVTGDRITEIGSVGATAVPDGATIVEGEGCYLIPGLVDAHSHIVDNEDSLILDLANGVTTIRDPNATYAGTGEQILATRDAINAGERLGPTIFAAKSIGALPPRFDNAFANLDLVIGPWLSMNRALFELAVDPETGRELVSEAYDEGYDYVKVNWFLSRATFDAVVETADKLGLPILAHVPAEVGVEHLIRSGGEIQHNPNLLAYVARGYERHPGVNYLDVFDMSQADQRLPELVSLMAESDVAFTPTFSTDEAALTLFDTLGSWDDYFSRPEYRYVPPATVAEWKDPAGGEFAVVLRDAGASSLEEILPPAEQRQEMMGHYQRQLVALVDAGVPVLAGSDASALGVVWGFSEHRELELFVEAGLTPYQALSAATRIPSEVMGESAEFGTIEPGKRADLVLLTASPLDEISNTREIRGVMTRGRWLPESELQAMLDNIADRYEAQAQGAVVMEPISTDLFDGVAPAGWTELEPGAVARGNPEVDPTVLVQLAAPESDTASLASDVLERYGVQHLPLPRDRIETTNLAWDVYLIQAESTVLGLALSETDGTACLVLIAATPEEADALAGSVFIPAVQAFAPAG